MASLNFSSIVMIVSLNSLSGILSESVSFGTISVGLVLLGIILIILS